MVKMREEGRWGVMNENNDDGSDDEGSYEAWDFKKVVAY